MSPTPPHDARRVGRLLAAGCLVGLVLGSAPLLEWGTRHEMPDPLLRALRAWDEANPLSGWHGAVRRAVEAAQARRF